MPVTVQFLTSREADFLVTSSLLLRSTTFVASFCTKRSLPPCPAAAHSRVTEPRSSWRNAGTAVACAAAMLNAADAKAGDANRLRTFDIRTLPIASSCVRSDVEGSSCSTKQSDNAGTPSHLQRRARHNSSQTNGARHYRYLFKGSGDKLCWDCGRMLCHPAILVSTCITAASDAKLICQRLLHGGFIQTPLRLAYNDWLMS